MVLLFDTSSDYMESKNIGAQPAFAMTINTGLIAMCNLSKVQRVAYYLPFSKEYNLERICP